MIMAGRVSIPLGCPFLLSEHECRVTASTRETPPTRIVARDRNQRRAAKRERLEAVRSFTSGRVLDARRCPADSWPTATRRTRSWRPTIPAGEMETAQTRRRLRAGTPLAALTLITAACTASTVGTRSAVGTPSSPTLTTRPFPCPSPGRSKPTVVLVHGAWADTSSWNGEVASLRRAGYAVRAIANPLRNLTTDSASVADFLRTIPGPIVLVGHSYGGWVITNAAATNQYVKALVYIDAAAPDVGETTGQLSGSGSALTQDPGSLYDKVSSPDAAPGVTDLYLKQEVFVRYFASDLPRDTALRLWATQRAASTSAFTTPTKAAAWRKIPSWYLVSTGDRIITPDSELSMAHRAHAKITEFRGGSHLTLISHPDAVTAVIGAAVCSVR